MNKTLEDSLKQAFIMWRNKMTEIENSFLKGSLSYSEYVQTLANIQREASYAMFDLIHTASEW